MTKALLPPLRVAETPGLRFRGLGRRSLGAKSQKVSKKSRKSLPGPPGPGVPKLRKKSRKRSEKSPKTHLQTFWRLFGPFSRLFSDFWDPGPGGPFETFSRLFWRLWPRNSFSQVHATSTPGGEICAKFYHVSGCHGSFSARIRASLVLSGPLNRLNAILSLLHPPRPL